MQSSKHLEESLSLWTDNALFSIHSSLIDLNIICKNNWEI